MRKVLIISLAVIFFMSCAKKENVAVQGVKLNIAEKDSLLIYFDKQKEGEGNKQQVYTDAIYATLIPFTATNKGIEWTSENPEVATVTTGEKGECILTPAGQGETNVIVTTKEGGFKASCRVVVKNREALLSAFALKIPRAKDTLKVGQSIKAEIDSIKPDFADHTLTWSSSDESIVTVTADGLITAKAGGTAIVTAVPNATPAKLKKCSITVISDKYVDEYNVDHGTGTKVGNIYWAPVNCGYNEETLPYGKLFQWGRKDGQGQDEYQEVIIDTLKANGKPNKARFYKNWNEKFAADNTWGYGESAINENNNPCPAGWRIPTKEEFEALTESAELENVLNKANVFAGNRDTIGKAASANLSKVAYIWTSTPAANNASVYIYNSYDNSGIFYDMYRAMGCAVRCVRDDK